jgi:urease accessory protein
MLRPSWLLPVCLCFLALPATADAHVTVQGMGEFVNGLAHPVTTPAHVLILLGLGSLLGQQAPLQLKMPLLVFAPLSAIALFFTTTGLVTMVYQPVLIGIALCVGTLVALELRVAPVLSSALCAAGALVIGLDSGTQSPAAIAMAKALVGTWISQLVVLADLAFYVSFWSKKKWVKVGVRVVGSWIIAISFLVLALELKKGVIKP